jgi:hypothetical protein
MRIFLALTLLPFILVIPIQSPSAQQKIEQREIVLFSVNGNTQSGRNVIIEPIAKIRGTNYQEPPDLCTPNDPEANRFQKKYFNVNHQYSVQFGGVAVGSLMVVPTENKYESYAAEMNVSLPLAFRQDAIATDSKKIGNAWGYRRHATRGENIAAKDLAEHLFIANHVPRSSLKYMKVEQLTVTQLERNGQPTMIVTAAIDHGTIDPDDDIEESLFFVATREKDAGTYSPSLVVYEKPTGAADAEKVYLVDVVDLDGDGTNEIVTMPQYYETTRFQIYKRDNGGKTWKKIYQTGFLGCE